MDGRRIFVGAAIAMLVTGGVIGCSNEDASRVVDGTTSTRAPGAPMETFAVGELIQLGDLRLIVHGMTDPFSPVNPGTRPPDGKRWVAVDLELQNLSDETVTINSLVQFQLQDAHNEIYNAIETDEGLRSIDAELGVGSSRRGAVVFELPSGADGLRLFFAGDVLSSGSVQVALE